MKLSKMHKRVLSPELRYALSPPKSYQPDEQVGHYGPYGWEGPNKKDKGQRLGSCNVTRCQRPGAFWYNKGSRAWYCTNCAHAINYRPLPDGSYLCSRDEDAYWEYIDSESKSSIRQAIEIAV